MIKKHNPGRIIKETAVPTPNTLPCAYCGLVVAKIGLVAHQNSTQCVLKRVAGALRSIGYWRVPTRHRNVISAAGLVMGPELLLRYADKLDFKEHERRLLEQGRMNVSGCWAPRWVLLAVDALNAEIPQQVITVLGIINKLPEAPEAIFGVYQLGKTEGLDYAPRVRRIRQLLLMLAGEFMIWNP